MLTTTETGHGSPVVLVHGTGVNATFWGDVPAALADNHRVVSYDRRGFGRSSEAPVSDYAIHAADLVGVLGAIGEPATVVGWSAGGIIALQAALDRPDLFRSLVLYEPPLHAKRHPTLGLVGTIARVQISRRLLRDEPRAATAFLRFVFAEPGGLNAMDRWSPEMLAEVERDAPATLMEIDAGTGEQLSAESIGALQVGTVGIAGRDTSPMPRAAMERLRGILPKMPVQTLPGGHGLHLDHPEAFAAVVTQAATADEVGQ